MSPLLQDWVTRQAELRPDAVAIVLGGEKLTYLQLEKRSNQLARSLQKAGCQKGDRVCFVMPKSPLAVVSMVGILKAGCIHVPLDSGSPPLRTHKILEACDTRWLLAAGPVLPLLNELFDHPPLRSRISVAWLETVKPPAATFQIEWSSKDIALLEPDPLARKASDMDPAHILFTSGSTGTPKGVVITHSNVIHFVEWGLRHFGLDCSDRLSGHTPLHFDLSTFDVFGTLAAGAQLHMLTYEVAMSPFKLAEFIRNAELTQWFSVPSVLNYMAKFNVVKRGDFPSLRRVLWCGEVLPSSALRYWMQRVRHARFTNLYGPTETTIASSFYDVRHCPEEKTPIPIGTACDGEELLVLSQDLQPVHAGEIGDLYIGGVGLSPGYWRDPEKTAAAFLHIARGPGLYERIYRTGDLAKLGEDGLLYFVGRNDTQIKSRGYRIELGEIEAALSSFSSLQESAVIAINRGGFEGWLICCAYVPQPGSHTTPNGVRKELEKHVPSYMIPVRWMSFPMLPKNSNGKIDRPKLKELFLTTETSELSELDSSCLMHAEETVDLHEHSSSG
jgi:amino acid adenylation domain-containing protein